MYAKTKHIFLLLLLEGLVAAGGASTAEALSSARPAGGTRWYVDAFSPAPAPAQDGESWESAFADLQDALAEAGSGDEIWVANGVYRPAPVGGSRSASFDLIDGVALYGGFQGATGGPGETQLSERDLEANEAILSGDLDLNDPAEVSGFAALSFSDPLLSENSLHVVTITGASSPTRLDGFTLKGGNADDAPGEGAAVRILSGSPTVANCRFELNQARRGALYTSGPAEVIECTFQFNRGEDGGAMRIEGNALVRNCEFRENFGIPGINGGDTNPNGSAIYNTAAPTVSGCLFRGNSVFDVDGGTPSRGGALYDSGAPYFANCTFEGNTNNKVGGAVYSIGSPAFVNVTFSGNAGDSGGAAAFQGNGAPVLLNCVLAANQASSGGGIWTSASVMLQNCILWGNEDAGGDVSNAQITESSSGGAFVEFSCIQDDDPGDGNVYLGLGNIDVDPLFLETPSDGGDGWGVGDNDDFGDLCLQAGSPAIDAGCNGCIGVDQADLDGDGDLLELVPVDGQGMPRFTDDPATSDTGVGLVPPGIIDLGPCEFGGGAEPVCQPDLGFQGPGTATLSACGQPLTPTGATDVLLEAAPAGAPAILLFGLFSNPLPLFGGTLVPVPWIGAQVFVTDANGEVLIPNVSSAAGPVNVFVQFVISDGAQPLGYQFSNALRLEFLP